MNDIYRNTILQLNKNPINYGILEGKNSQETLSNPMCGDTITLYAKFNKMFLKSKYRKFLKQIKFHGESCAITKASASLMTEIIKDKDTEQINQSIQEFSDILDGKNIHKESELSDELKIFYFINKYPARKTCAFLPWQALLSLLKKD